MQTGLLNAILKIESLIYDANVVLRFRDDIDMYAKEAADIILCPQTLWQCAEAIRKTLFINHCFRSRINVAIDNCTAVGVNKNKGGTCVGMATIYLILAELLQIKLVPCLFENHVSVSFNNANENEVFFIETTRRGSICTYKQITSCYGSIKQRLSLDEFIAIHLVNHSCVYYAVIGLTDDAVFLIDSALELFPDYTAGWINRAAMMKKLDNAVEMRRSLDMARSLNPGVRYTKAIEQIEGTKYE